MDSGVHRSCLLSQLVELEIYRVFDDMKESYERRMLLYGSCLVIIDRFRLLGQPTIETCESTLGLFLSSIECSVSLDGASLKKQYIEFFGE